MRKVLGFILPGLAFLLFVEIALWGLNRIISWDEYVHRTGLRYRKFLTNQEYENQFLNLKDPYVIWKLRPGELRPGCYVNKLGFRGDEISPQKAPGTKRIVCLGNSITLGMDVKTHADTYPMLLEQRLKQSQNQPIEVINAGVAGYSSYQILQQLRHYVLPLEPDLIIVLATFNDVLYTPYKPDKEIKLSKAVCVVYNALFSFRICRAINSGIQFISRHISSEEFLTPYDPEIGLQTRVSEEDYRKNLNSIAEDAEKRNIKAIFITSGRINEVPLAMHPLPKIVLDGHQRAVHWVPQLSPLIIRAGQIDINRLKNASQAQIRNLPLAPVPYYNLAKYYEFAGDSLLAREYYKIADSLDTTGQRYDRYNQIMREVAADHNIPIIDTYLLFDGEDPARYFVSDCIHLNEAGHAVIADALYRKVTEILN